MQVLLSLASTLLLLQPVNGAQGRGLEPLERAALATAADPGLPGLRAGGTSERIGFDPSERSALARAAAESRQLAGLRAGEVNLSDRDVKVILITAAVIVLLVLIF